MSSEAPSLPLQPSALRVSPGFLSLIPLPSRGHSQQASTPLNLCIKVTVRPPLLKPMTCHQQGTPARPASPKRFPTWFPEHHWLPEAPVSRCLSQPAHLLLCPGPQARTASCFHNVWNFPWPGPGSSSPCPRPFLSPAPHGSILLSLGHCGEPPPASHSPVPDPWGQPHASTFRAYLERTALTLWPRPRHPRLLVTQRPPRCPGRHPFSPSPHLVST